MFLFSLFWLESNFRIRFIFPKCVYITFSSPLSSPFNSKVCDWNFKLLPTTISVGRIRGNQCGQNIFCVVKSRWALMLKIYISSGWNVSLIGSSAELKCITDDPAEVCVFIEWEIPRIFLSLPRYFILSARLVQNIALKQTTKELIRAVSKAGLVGSILW